MATGIKSMFPQLLLVSTGLLAGAIVYWPIPYEQLDMLGRNFVLQLAFTSALLGVVATTLKRNAPFQVSTFFGVGAALSIVSKVIYDWKVIDPTSHNLWPLEVFIGIAIAVPCALLGSLLTNSLLKSIRRTSS